MDHIPDITPERSREIYEEMEQMWPDLWRICYPRIYREPSGGPYYSPKEPARQLMAVAIKIQHGMVGTSEKYEFIAASELVKYRVPMIWLGHDMAEAIRQTVPPGQIPWYTMPMPFPAAVFMLPKGALVHPEEGDVVFVAYARFPTGGGGVSKLLPGMPYGSNNGGMIFLAQAGKHLFHWNLPLDAYGDTISIPDIEGYVTHMTDDQNHDTGFSVFGQPEMNDADNRLMIGVAHYCFGSILLMNHRPDLLTKGVMKGRQKKGDLRELWSPNILGEHYRIKREKQAPVGTHASPRFHWVKGSYKQVAFGPKMELRKRRWIEPYTRGLVEVA